MLLRFQCPACFRKSLKAEASPSAITIHDLTCPKCKVRWRYKITPVGQFLTDGFVHKIENTALIQRGK